MEQEQPGLDAPDTMQAQNLELLTSGAVSFLTKKFCGLSFRDHLPEKYLDVVSMKLGKSLEVKDLSPALMGFDRSAPRGVHTICQVELADYLIELIQNEHPENRLLRTLAEGWQLLQLAEQRRPVPIVREFDNHEVREMEGIVYPDEIVELKKEFYRRVSGYTASEIRALHDLFSEKRAALGSLRECEFAPRYVANLYLREQDGDRMGEVRMSGKNPIHNGSFVAVGVSASTCFDRVVFALGLPPGYHVLAACGMARNEESHLFHLQNIRMKLKAIESHRMTGKKIITWKPLYAQTYSQALAVKQQNDESPRFSFPDSLESLWMSSGKDRMSYRNAPEVTWVTGQDLAKELGQPNEELRHTVRCIALRKGPLSGEGEVLLVTERGDNAAERIGKPPMIGLPGGMREKGITLLDTLEREFCHEAQTRKVMRVVARIMEQEKSGLRGPDAKNNDHYYYIEADREAGLSRQRVEVDEIYSVDWYPFSRFASFSFQHTRQSHLTVWDVEWVHEKLMMSPNQAYNLSLLIPAILERTPQLGISLPDNWKQFRENAENFLSENR